MIISNLVEVSWNTNNIKHYTSIGYTYTRMKERFFVSVNHLPQNSSAIIELKCDYCGEIFNRRYKDHTKIKNKNLTSLKDSCNECRFLKTREIIEAKQLDGMLTINSNAYWTFKENRLLELKKYIEKYKTLDNMYSGNDEGSVVYHNFGKNGHSITDAIIELGYDLSSVMTRMPRGYYDSFENILLPIQGFINAYGKFPTVQEIKYNLSIDYEHIAKHGGIHEIKRKMNYNVTDGLKDDSGFYNSSVYEYNVAQYLIHNTNLTYLREQNPFPENEKHYRSDFTLITQEDKRVHIEIWGMDENKKYRRVMNKKIKLYNKYNIELLSIPSLFFKAKMDTIQERLYEVFSKYADINMKKIDCKLLTPVSNFTDEELLEEIMQHSEDNNKLPNSSHLKNIGKYKLYDEASKRYGNYHDFGKHFSKSTTKVNQGYWNKESICNEVNTILQFGYSLHRKDLRLLRKISLLEAIIRFYGGLINFRLYFYDIHIEQISYLNEYELKFIDNISRNKGVNIMNKVTSEQMLLARRILERWHNTNRYTNLHQEIPILKRI